MRCSLADIDRACGKFCGLEDCVLCKDYKNRMVKERLVSFEEKSERIGIKPLVLKGYQAFPPSWVYWKFRGVEPTIWLGLPNRSLGIEHLASWKLTARKEAVKWASLKETKIRTFHAPSVKEFYDFLNGHGVLYSMDFIRSCLCTEGKLEVPTLSVIPPSGLYPYLKINPEVKELDSQRYIGEILELKG